MPRHRSLKTVCVETIFLIIMFASVGHLCVHFWERYILQTELSNMKCSLHSLKETINNIGHAYDNLYKELKELAQMAEKHSTMILNKKDPYFYKCKTYNDLDTNKCSALAQTPGHDLKVQTIIVPMHNISTKVDKPLSCNKTSQGINMNHKDLDNFAKSGKNATTITRYPPKSTGAGSDKYKLEKYPTKKNYCEYTETSSCTAHRCYRPYDTCSHCKF